MTIEDIARLAGVSIATVSRVINSQGASKKTRENVIRIIKKYGYCPNSFARYLGRRNKARGIKRI